MNSYDQVLHLAMWNVLHSVIASEIHLLCEAIFSPNKKKNAWGNTKVFSAGSPKWWNVKALIWPQKPTSVDLNFDTT